MRQAARVLVAISTLVGCTTISGIDDLTFDPVPTPAGGAAGAGNSGAVGGATSVGSGAAQASGGAPAVGSSSSSGNPCGDGSFQCSDGCHDLASDVANCGVCMHECTTQNASATLCTSGVCRPVCDVGFLDCEHPDGADDGCDSYSGRTKCGGCANHCDVGLACVEHEGTIRCGCRSDGDCGAAGLCTGDLCVCSTDQCSPGEICQAGRCSCNGGSPCATGKSCCGNPLGCFSLSSDTQHCGGCGIVCPPGWSCISGKCTL